MQRLLEQWQRGPDLASLRDPEAIRKLPPEEQAACRKFWAEVAALLKKAIGE